MNTCLGPGLILWYDVSDEKGIRDLVCGMLGACRGQVHLEQQPGNRVLRIFGLTRDEVIRDWRKLHNEELNDL
jgi:hypothetical protein